MVNDYQLDMKIIGIAEFKSCLFTLLREIENSITNGKKKETVTVLVPMEGHRESKLFDRYPTLTLRIE